MVIEKKVKIQSIVRNIEQGTLVCKMFFYEPIDINKQVVAGVAIHNVGFLLFSDLEELDVVTLKYMRKSEEYSLMLTSGFNIKCSPLGNTQQKCESMNIVDFDDIHTNS